MGYAHRLSHGGGFRINPIPSLMIAGWSDYTACLYWVVPDEDFTGVTVRVSTSGYPSQTSGTLVYDGAGNTIYLTTSQTVKGCPFAGSANTTYYFSVFSYRTDSAGYKHYSNDVKQGSYSAVGYSINSANYTGASSGSTVIDGGIALYSDGTFTVPAGIRSIDIFLVGAGGKGGDGYVDENMNYWCGGGGGSGRTANHYGIAVTPGQTFTVDIGNTSGASTSFGSYSVAGGDPGGNGSGGPIWDSRGGNGGSGGGGGGANANGNYSGGAGGTNGAGGSESAYGVPGGSGQGHTQAFGTGTVYAAGGHGGYGGGAAGANNTGNGGGGGYTGTGAAGGSGIVIVRKAA